MITKTCLTCKQEYILGVNGTIHGCDKCCGVERINDQSSTNAAWFPGETYHNIGGKRVTREQARAYSQVS